MPYIGYFQLINSVDTFVVYDNIEYTKKGWINRNRILVNGKDEYITLPLKNDSDFLHVNERYLAESFHKEKIKILRKIKESYRKAPYFSEVYNLIEEILNYNDHNLFQFIFNSINKICNYLEIRTKLIISSNVNINHHLKSQDKVIAICKELKANVYINPIGGIELYSKNEFNNEGLNLKFLKSNEIQYNQFQNNFVPFLSILDLMVFISPDKLKKVLTNYDLINV